MGAAEQHDYFSPVAPRVLAHRGLAIRVPENTLAAFRLAVDAGAGYLETDVRATSDGVAVLAHDATLKRLVGDRRPIAELTLAELQAIDLGGDRVPTLAEALTAFPMSRFNIDVKAAAAAAPAAAAVKSAVAGHRVLLTSFSERRRRAAAAAAGGVASSASFGLMLRALVFAKCGAHRTLARILRGVQAVQIPERQFGIRLVTPMSIATMHRVGVEVHVWTVNEEADMRRLLQLGVDGLVTDRCDLALEVVASRS